MLPLSVTICMVIGFACSIDAKSNADETAVGFVRTRRSVDDATVKRVNNKNFKGIEKEYYLSLDMNMEWEQFLLPAPLSVALMGQLIVISVKRDFPLTKPTIPGKQYKRIKYMYFRPTLIQIANEGWHAFEKANSNMNQVRLLSASIPRYVKAILKFLDSGKPKIIHKFVPMALGAVSKASKKCSDLAVEVEKKFIGVMELLGEVDEAVAATKGVTDERLLNISRELSEAKEEKKFLDKIYKKTKEQFDKLEKQLEKDRHDYIEAVKNIPSGWKATVQGLLRSFKVSDLISFVTTGWIGVAMTAIRMATDKGNKGGGGGPGIGGVPGASQGPSADQVIEDQLVLHYASNMYGSLANLPNRLNSVVDIIARNQQNASTSTIGALQEKADALTKGVQIVKGRVKTQTASTFHQETMKVIRETLKQTEAMSKLFRGDLKATDKAKVVKMRHRMAEIVAVLKRLSAARAIKTGSVGPAPKESGGGGGGGGSDPERYIAAQRLQTLLENSRRYEIYYQHLKAANQKVTDIMVKIAGLDMDEINYKEIRKILREGIDALSKFRKVWNLLINFFQMISGLSDVTLKKSVQTFFDYTNATLVTGLGLNDPASTSVIREAIQEEAIRVATAARFLHTLTATYTTVSGEYLMEPLTVLPALQKIENPDQQKAKLKELYNDAKAAQAKIRAMVDRERQKYKKEVKKQTADIKSIYSIVGEPSSDDLKAIEDGKKAAESPTPYCMLDCPIPVCLVGC